MFDDEAIVPTPKCRLCLINDADQTGSHITSAFLVASQIGKRGEEHSHVITTNPKQDYSENTGDREIKEDYIFCRDCEKRISFIENIYSSEITNKIEEDRFAENFPMTQIENNKYISCIRINPIAFHLMIYSYIWRASISTNRIYQNLKLSESNEEDLRFTLDLFLPNTIDHKIIQTVENWKKMVENCQDLFNYFPYYLLKAEKLEDKTRNYEFCDNISFDPYQIILNEYIILPFFDHMTYQDDFLQVKKFVDIPALNNNFESPKILIISNEAYLAVINMIQSLAAKQRINEIEEECIIELIDRGETVIDSDTLKRMVQEKVNKITLP